MKTTRKITGRCRRICDIPKSHLETAARACCITILGRRVKEGVVAARRAVCRPQWSAQALQVLVGFLDGQVLWRAVVAFRRPPTDNHRDARGLVAGRCGLGGGSVKKHQRTRLVPSEEGPMHRYVRARRHTGAIPCLQCLKRIRRRQAPQSCP